MSVKTNSSSALSLDSLESDRKDKKAKEIHPTSGDKILVPFYEKDVLVEIDKSQMRIFNRKHNRPNDINDRKPETEIKSYLVNKNTNKSRKPSYLEALRRKFPLEFTQDNKNLEEIRSISPEFGDTERDSISDEETSPNHDFYETEAYNDIYYEKIMNQEVADAFDKNLEEVKRTQDTNPFNDYIIDNLRSISELTQPRRRSRRASVEPVPNIRLGGLGPDIENIKPRLERAKSLQRYSEKVRMENKLKIYKKSHRDTSKSQKGSTGTQKVNLSDKNVQKENGPTYLVKKSLPGSKIIHEKSKSANARNGRTDCDSTGDGNSNESNQICIKDRKSFIKKDLVVRGTSAQKHIKTTFKEAKKNDKNSSDTKGNEVSEKTTETPNFDALKSLEEKHRMYQERVKQFQIFCTPNF
ncbi:uncharacterized protein LOC121739100 [Aricia agestis]|uniref:uncharacterized protein LOC121739100 n=1 Tax=Aricia agestis TaxID=91739 RepID=UPI001C20B0DD|nr:uncharacterized protein LOC121739100 [Aricia agestis]